MASPITPYKISVPDAKLAELKAKLEAATFPDELDDAGWSMGAPLQDVRRLASVWKDSFDWRAAERKLNDTLPQFTTTVTVPGFDPIEIHFVHQRSAREAAIPLLFVHGWPGSFYEASKVAPLLAASDDPNAPSFHVVAPSLPNFGFSAATRTKGFGLKQYAQAMHAVMIALGYSDYVAQGGDWGTMLSRIIARLYPDNVRAIHLNMPISHFPKPWANPIVFVQALLGILLSPSQRAGLKHSQQYMLDGNGYMVQQSTRPQTLGYGLADSPVATLAWVYEKLHFWTDNYPWSDEEVLTWVSIYVFSRAGPAASTRIYYEATHPGPDGIHMQSAIGDYVPKVPQALAYFPGEIARLPKAWAHTTGVIVQQSDFEAGGHFAAFEVPELLARDVKKLFGTKGPCADVVPGKSGY